MNLDFDALKNEKQAITDFLSQPNAYADPNFAAKNRRLNEIDELISLGEKIEQLKSDIQLNSIHWFSAYPTLCKNIQKSTVSIIAF